MADAQPATFQLEQDQSAEAADLRAVLYREGHRYASGAEVVVEDLDWSATSADVPWHVLVPDARSSSSPIDEVNGVVGADVASH